MFSSAIKTNHKFRPLLSWTQLTPREQKGFSHLTAQDDEPFIRYYDTVYHTDEFSILEGNPTFPDWQGILIDSLSSGVLIKYSPDCCMVKIATFSF